MRKYEIIRSIRIKYYVFFNYIKNFVINILLKNLYIIFVNNMERLIVGK